MRLFYPYFFSPFHIKLFLDIVIISCLAMVKSNIFIIGQSDVSFLFLSHRMVYNRGMCFCNRSHFGPVELKILNSNHNPFWTTDVQVRVVFQKYLLYIYYSCLGSIECRIYYFHLYAMEAIEEWFYSYYIVRNELWSLIINNI